MRKDNKVDEDDRTKFKNKSKGRRPRAKKGNSKPMDHGNDLSWHAKSDTLLTAAASIPWSYSTGAPIHRTNSIPGGGAGLDVYVPGIFAIRTLLTPGVGDQRSDAVNIAAMALYTDLRRHLKSANQYEASDVMIYITAIGEILAYIQWCTRLYATTMMYSFTNRYLPDALITMQGVDPDSLHNNALDFLSRMNQLISKASQIWIPKGFDYLERCRWEYANYYSEGSDIKDQIYMFTPAGFRTFTLLEEADYSGALVPNSQIQSSTRLTYVQICDILEDMINALVNDTDFCNIAGDLLNAYGDSGVMQFSLIPQDAIMTVISGAAAYEVLEQIQNAKICEAARRAWFNDYTQFKVKQNETRNVLEVVNNFDISWPDYGTIMSEAAPILTVHENPSPAKTMLITRLINMPTQITGGSDADHRSIKVEAACEWVLEFLVSSYTAGYPDDSTGPRVEAYKSNYDMNNRHTSADERLSILNDMAILRPFHYAPNIYFLLTEDTIVQTKVCGSLDITSTIDIGQLIDLNRIDLMSLFAVPDIGKITGK